MKHLSDGALRRMIDQPDSLDRGGRAHVEECERCRGRAAAIASTAERAAMVMERRSSPTVDPVPALQGLRKQGLGALSPAPAASVWKPAGLRSKRLLKPVITVALVSLTGLALVGTGVAANLVKIFEPEQVVAVPVDLQTLNTLPDLTRYGTFTFGQKPIEQEAASLQEAAQRTGLRLLTSSQMPEVTGPERITTLTRGSVSFTFDAAKAGAGAGDLPDDIDGSTLTLDAGPAVIHTFGAAARPQEASGPADRKGDLADMLSALPNLMIVQMKAPIVSSDGPSVEDYREALLELPDLSESLKAQIRAIGDPSATLPVPVPINVATSREVDIDGITGLLVGDNTGVGSGVVWQSGGMVRAVGGTLPQDEVLAIARSMR